MTTARGLVDLTVSTGGMRQGSALYLAAQARRSGNRRLAEYLQKIADTPGAEQVVARHPRDLARGAARRDKAGLTDSDRMWLARLPTDPKQIRWEDAVALAELVASVDSMAHPSDARLLASIWEPVDALHSRRVAEQRLANTRRPLPAIPDGAVDVVAEALAGEVDGLTEQEVRARAAQMLQDAMVARDLQHGASVVTAQADLDALDTAAADRARVAP